MNKSSKLVSETNRNETKKHATSATIYNLIESSTATVSTAQAYNQGGAGARIPPRKICWTYFETVEHYFKNLVPSEKTSLPLVFQAGYGPFAAPGQY